MRRWWRTRSVRARLAFTYAATTALALLAYALGVFLFVNHVLRRDLDARVHDDFKMAEESLQVTTEGVSILRPRNNREHDEHQPWIEIWEGPGAIRFRTPRAGSAMLDDLRQMPNSGYTVASVRAATGERLRTMTGTAAFNGVTYAIRAARSEEPVHHELQELYMGMIVAFPLIIGLSGLAGAHMARRALRPVERMAQRARNITAERLSDRLPIENPDDELGQLAAVFNDTLGRLETSFDRLRRFTADASHELRTPLTAIRSVGEVGMSERHEAAGYRDIIGSMLEEAERLTRLVESLLILSRADAGGAVLRLESLELSDLARDVVNDLYVLAEEKHQVVRVEGSEPVIAVADRLTLTQALVNLLDNAIKYSPEGATIVIIVSADGGAHVDVNDQGPGIAPEHHQRIFDRFYRVDESRARGNGGAGLGLSIAHWAVRANGGRLTLHHTNASGSTFRISLASPSHSSF